jgi:hypothetical protein
MAQINPVTFGLPPDLLELIGGVSSQDAPRGSAPLSFAPTAMQAQPDRAALEQQAYGYTPQEVKEPNKFLTILQTLLAGYADGQSASAQVLGGAQRTNALGNLRALRQRREEMRREESGRAQAYKREGAKDKLSRLDKEADEKSRREFQSGENALDRASRATPKLSTKRSEADEDLVEAKKAARDAGVDFDAMAPDKRNDIDYIYAQTAKRNRETAKEKQKRDTDTMTKAQEQTAIRALADDFYRSHTKPTKKMVKKTDPYGGVTEQESTVEEPGISFAEAMEMARDEFYGRKPKAKPAPKKGISLQDVREKLRGATPSE